MDIVYDIMALVGIALMALGTGLYSYPAGFITAGAGLFAVALWGAHEWAS